MATTAATVCQAFRGLLALIRETLSLRREGAALQDRRTALMAEAWALPPLEREGIRGTVLRARADTLLADFADFAQRRNALVERGTVTLHTFPALGPAVLGSFTQLDDLRLLAMADQAQAALGALEEGELKHGKP